MLYKENEASCTRGHFAKVSLNVSSYTNRIKITCHRLRNGKGRTGDISSSETRPFLFQPLKDLEKQVFTKSFSA